MKVKLSASIMCANFSHLRKDIEELEKGGIDYLHFDIMDGHFVPNFTMGPDILKTVRKLTSLSFDTHLMVENPDEYIPVFIEAGSNLIFFHIEASLHPQRTIYLIKKEGAKAGIALNPATPLCQLNYLLPKVSSVLIMGVEPGFAGQTLISSTIPKIRNLKKMIEERNLNVDIEVDGNISFANAPLMVEAGANILVCGTSSIFKPKMGIRKGIEKLREVLK